MLLLRDGQGEATVIHRGDYTAPAYLVDSVDLTFDLDAAKTRVLNKMTLRRNPAVAAQPLKLDGEELNLARVLVNGQGTSFKMEGSRLVLENLPEGDAARALPLVELESQVHLFSGFTHQRNILRPDVGHAKGVPTDLFSLSGMHLLVVARWPKIGEDRFPLATDVDDPGQLQRRGRTRRLFGCWRSVLLGLARNIKQILLVDDRNDLRQSWFSPRRR